MIIAINTCHLTTAAHFIFDCFSRIAKEHPEHQFIYITDSPLDDRYISSKNITAVTITERPRSSLLWPYWYNYKVPAILRKHKADIFVSTDGACSLRSKVSQYMVLQDLDFIHAPGMMNKAELRFYKKYTGRFVSKARAIAVTSPFAKTTISDKYTVDEEKIRLISPGADPVFKPISEATKELVKAQQTDGKEYFLYSGNIDPRNNLMNLLKAFSFFKKRQKSNMQLLITGNYTGNHQQFTTDLSTFKYRNEVKILTGLSTSEQAAIMAAAYALVYPVISGNFSPCLPQAMQCEVPVICSKNPALSDICGEAALYAGPDNFNDIAEKMMLVFKDEDKRGKLIAAGKIQAKNHNQDKAAAVLWQLIAGTMQA